MPSASELRIHSGACPPAGNLQSATDGVAHGQPDRSAEDKAEEGAQDCARPCLAHNSLTIGLRMGLTGLFSGAIYVSTLCLEMHLDCTSIYITTVIVASAAEDCLGQGFFKAFDRAVGTLLGGLLGELLLSVRCALTQTGIVWLERMFIVFGFTLISASGFLLVTASKSKLMKAHQYVFTVACLTLGFVWLSETDNGVKLYWRALHRLISIVIGIFIALGSLIATSPGVAISVIHVGLAATAKDAAVLLQKQWIARINQHALMPLTACFQTKFTAEDDAVREKCRSIRDRTTKLRALLAYIPWEPKCFYPRRLSRRAQFRYRLLIERLAQINATFMAIDVQLRAFSVVTPLDDAVSKAVQGLMDLLTRLLMDGADKLDEMMTAKQHTGADAVLEVDKRLAPIRSSMEGLIRAAQGVDESGALGVAQEGTKGGELTEYIHSLCGATVDTEFSARTASAFVYLTLQLGMQVILFFVAVVTLVEGECNGDEAGLQQDHYTDQADTIAKNMDE